MPEIRQVLLACFSERGPVSRLLGMTAHADWHSRSGNTAHCTQLSKRAFGSRGVVKFVSGQGFTKGSLKRLASSGFPLCGDRSGNSSRQLADSKGTRVQLFSGRPTRGPDYGHAESVY